MRCWRQHAAARGFEWPSQLRASSSLKVTFFALVAKRINPKVVVSGVVVCLYDAATKLAQEVVNDLGAFLEKSRGANVPWANCKVFGTRIRRNIKLAECPSHGRSIFGYAPKCPGAIDYLNLAREVMGEAALAAA